MCEKGNRKYSNRGDNNFVQTYLKFSTSGKSLEITSCPLNVFLLPSLRHSKSCVEVALSCLAEIFRFKSSIEVEALLVIRIIVERFSSSVFRYELSLSAELERLVLVGGTASRLV